jgi:hypothetical protein
MCISRVQDLNAAHCIICFHKLCAYETTLSRRVKMLGAVEGEYEARCRRGADQRRRRKGEMRKGDGGLT